MTDEYLALGKRAADCKHWRFTPGMRVQYPDGAALRIQDMAEVVAFFGVRAVGRALAGALPDISDAATVGCLLQLVRDAWGGHAQVCDPEMSTMEDGTDWMVLTCRKGGVGSFFGVTEAEALVVALEAAP